MSQPAGGTAQLHKLKADNPHLYHRCNYNAGDGYRGGIVSVLDTLVAALAKPPADAGGDHQGDPGQVTAVANEV